VYAATLGIDAGPGAQYDAQEARFAAAARQLEEGGGLERGPQGAGLPVLLAPAVALGGAGLAALLGAAVAALAFVLGAALARRVVPDPWATWAALLCGLSPPALGLATTLVPALWAGALLTGAMLCALAARERPLMRFAFGGGALLAVLPWLDPWLLVPAAPVAFFLARWTARRGRPLVALGSLEIQLAGLVFYGSLNERLYGRLTPSDELRPRLERTDRLVTLFADPGFGLLRWAPVFALAGFGAWLLVRSRRTRLAKLVSEQRDAEHAAFLALVVCAAQVLVAAFVTPSVDGPGFPGRTLGPALPCAVPLVAWGLRNAPRWVAAGLAGATAVLSGWVLVALWTGAVGGWAAY
jgi:hypothetical protein